MYENFYRLSSKPFHLNPDPRFFYASTGHRRVLDYLNYGIHQREGFLVVTGEVGTGKTTLIYHLLQQLAAHEDIIAAHLATTQPGADNVLAMVAAAFELPHEGLTNAALMQRIYKFAMEQAQAGKRPLVIVDEVQNLTRDGLEALRMLTNFQADHKALLQAFLIGQAEFRNTLQSGRLEQLRQRIIASCHLGPLDLEETQRYIEHRLKIVGWQGDPALPPETFVFIHDFTAGVPRRVNNLCDRLLLVAYLEEAHVITKELVGNVIQELRVEMLGNPQAAGVENPELRDFSAPAKEADNLIVEEPAQTNLSLEQKVIQLEQRLAALETTINKVKNAFATEVIPEEPTLDLTQPELTSDDDLLLNYGDIKSL